MQLSKQLTQTRKESLKGMNLMNRIRTYDRGCDGVHFKLKPAIFSGFLCATACLSCVLITAMIILPFHFLSAVLVCDISIFHSNLDKEDSLQVSHSQNKLK